jgi:hypothetical protein
MNAAVAEIGVQHDADGEELLLLTVPRNAALLRELRARLGRRMRAYKVAPRSLTFVVDDEPCADNVTSIFDTRLKCVRRAAASEPHRPGRSPR